MIGGFAFAIFTLLPLLANREIRAEEKSSSQTQTIYQPPLSKPEDISSEQTQTIYQPPLSERVLDSLRRAGGGRGNACNSKYSDATTLAVPADHVGTTISARPSFIWYMSRDVLSLVRFTLVRKGSLPLLVKEFNGLKKGFFALKIPEDSPGLEIGKSYKWTVTIVCSERRPSKNLYASAMIKRIPVPLSINSEKANCNVDFAFNGIWYDAINCSYSHAANEPKDSPTEFARGFYSLLFQVDLGDLLTN